jgi:hypothetical protein
MLKDKMRKKYQFKKFIKVKKTTIKRIKIKYYKKKVEGG